MSKKNEQQHDAFENVENVLSKTEQYIEDNQKSLTIIVVVAVLIIGGYLGFKKFYLSPQENDAQSQMFVAEQYFEKDSFNLALNGFGEYPGFLEIIDDYGITKTANLARYYAGISYLNLGQYEEAIDYLKKFDSDDNMLAPIATGAIGDANMELGNAKTAVSYYEKAANMVENNFTAPIYLMKAGLAYEELGDNKAALEMYKTIKADYAKTTEGRQIEKYIARVEAKMN